MARRTAADPDVARRRRRPPPGAAPGALMVDPNAPQTLIELIAYGPDGVVEERIESPAMLRDRIGRWPVTWVNVAGLGDEATLKQLGETFSLHPLALADVVNVYQRAKADTYPEHLFIVARMFEHDVGIQTDQLSLFLGAKYLVTFQERPGDCFDPVRERIRAGRGRIRIAGTGYLAYSLLDAVVDSYFPLLETFGERLEKTETQIFERPTQRSIQEIHAIKRDLLTLRRSIWPMRDMLNGLLRDPNPYIEQEDRLYLQDAYDHAVQVMDLLETFRELGSNLMDVYLSSVSNRLNEVMKILTMFTAIFIPLSFIAGVYGMNFDVDRSPWNMPELRWYYGYPFALLIMGLVAVGLLIFFRRRGWLGGHPEEGAPPTPRIDREPPAKRRSKPPSGSP
ncbi:MAG TPA: magnesium/cobalt transporter CorA [Candidatus Limnocylindria bacterium]|nr:magnesium/cobalt transporter CorA [Candidatus Limnocylindria bacterium]